MSAKQQMEIASAWVEVNELHDNVKYKSMTPAEALIARKFFGIKVTGQAKPTNPITHLKIVDRVDRSAEAEFSRLAGKYGVKTLESIFPGENPNIPMTFASAGFEETKESAPKAGPKTEVVPLAKLSKAETSDEQSVAELRRQVTQVNLLAKQQQEIEALKMQLTIASGVVSAPAAPKEVLGEKDPNADLEEV